MHVLNPPPPGTKTKEPTLVELISSVKPAKWYLFGLKVGIDKDDLDVIVANNRNDVEGAREAMFKKWVEDGDNLTWRTVVDAMKEIGMKNKAKELEKKFC